MANTIKLKRSATPSAVPTTGQLDLGEMAINTYDGKVYIKKDNGTPSIVEVGSTTPPAGSNTQIQFNDAGSFGGDADFTWNKTTNVLTVNGNILINGTTTLGDAGADTITVNASTMSVPNNLSIAADTIYIDNTNSRVGIGTSTPDVTLDIRSQGTSNTRGVQVTHFDNTTAFSQAKFIGSRARGSNGSPAAVQANDSLASFNGRGYKTSAWSDTVGGFYVYAAENWTNTATGSYLTLRGATPGGTTVTEYAKFESTGVTLSGNTTQRYQDFATAGDAQSRTYILKATTTNATQTEMLIAGANRMVLANDTTWHFDIHVVARRTDTDNESAGYRFYGAIDRNATAGSTAIVGTVTENIDAEDTSAWSVTVDADTTNGALRVQVTGESGKTIRWVAFARTVEVTG